MCQPPAPTCQQHPQGFQIPLASHRLPSLGVPSVLVANGRRDGAPAAVFPSGTDLYFPGRGTVQLDLFSDGNGGKFVEEAPK